LVNLSDTTFTREQVRTLALGPNYALVKEPKEYITELIIDTENTIRQLDTKLQNTFRHLASTKIKQIMTTSNHHALHKRYQYNLNQIKNILKKNNLRIAKADKNKALVVINKNTLEHKIMTFIQEINVTCLN
jgi:tRNA U34 5-carboxymethylaminomethyl modifying GTPase MnmE/TrmE